MSVRRRFRLIALVTLATLGSVLVTAAYAQDGPLPPSWNEPFRALEPLSRTGVIYDRVLPIAHLERLDGSVSAPTIGPGTWRQAYDELRRASLAAPVGPDLATLDADARVAYRLGVIPLALLDRPFERARPDALGDGAVRVANGRLEPVNGTALVTSRAVAAAALAPRTYRGADVTFALDRQRCFSDPASPLSSVVMDFADGRGPRPVALGEGIRVRYATPGPRTLSARITRVDGTEAEARFTFDVAAVTTPTPNDTLHITATIPYQGQFGTGDAYVYLAANHATIENPIVVVEGFDLDNSMNWDELYALLNEENLIETLRADGFDAVVLNFTDATAAIEQNGFVVEELVQQVQSIIPVQRTLALVGASMGGLCSRYALAYMESHAIPHRVRTWLSFDAPHAGADIPLGLQYWISFFSGQSTDAAAFLAILQRPAAREMLIYHLTSPPGTTGQSDPLRGQLLSTLTAVGDYPSLPRRVAIANGSGDGDTQGFLPGNQLIRWEYSSAFVAITGNVWAVPNLVNTTVFQGSLRILFSTTTQNVAVSGTAPWDGAPGGSRASLAELDAIAAPYGDIVALHPSHCFIPSVSALALPTGDPFFDIAGTPNLVALSPFDAVYYPTTNQEHVSITPENAVWIRDELEQGVVGVALGDGAGGHSGVSLSASPSPFHDAAQIAYGLLRAGHVDLRVFDIRGREVCVLVNDTRAAGVHRAQWDGRDARGARAGSGVFFLQLQSEGEALSRRVVKLD
jgi:triacylglycerol esterase/lipase EstA (alpha/beta hydrolase family)